MAPGAASVKTEKLLLAEKALKSSRPIVKESAATHALCIPKVAGRD